MRDPGLSEAIQAAGGVTELARRMGISQPSVSNWEKVPAERVLLVEETTGISRQVLRPDLYRDPDKPARTRDETDVARAQEYALLSTLLSRAPDAAFLK
jgi:DNA-binding transcriptional regulator YdaS (Cro superfamily)